MKLKQDCIRETLLFLEENMSSTGFFHSQTICLKNFSKDEINYTIRKLEEANYLKINCIMMTGDIIIECLTFEGHKFLDNIRDEKVWSTTKSIVSKFSSVSLGIIENVSAQVITNIIIKNLGH